MSESWAGWLNGGVSESWTGWLSGGVSKSWAGWLSGGVSESWAGWLSGDPLNGGSRVRGQAPDNTENLPRSWGVEVMKGGVRVS